MKKNEECYYLKDIFWICYFDDNAKGKSVPIVYNENRTAIKNLNTNEIISGDFTKTTPAQIAEKLNLKTPFCQKISGESVAYSIIADTMYILLPSELKTCTYFDSDYGRHIDNDDLSRYASRKLMSSKDLEKYSKKISKIFEKDNKDIIKNIKQNCVENSRDF